ncbi:hypothetical protein B0T20DRAFT_453325 [Sordaria brevicollis]|uniref:Uncharacterized protein n=1 Tax=Sordaria brevicollis TaxID=83679 RepID=A0AAE0PEZ7_SORBR|nr:hypothetical protein B0T20DRAFT_453325 [Sordaria brevicollis]
MIYRYAWKVHPKPYRRGKTSQLEMSYLKAQLLAIGKLGAICQQMRTEAGSRLSSNVHYKEIILSSPLLLAHLRHVSFCWAQKTYRSRRPGVTPMEACYWLQCLKQLKTLEIVITDLWLLIDRPKELSTIFTNLRGLQKATVKFDIETEGPRVSAYTNPERNIQRLEATPYFQKFRKAIEGLVTLPKDTEPPSQVIKEFLGCLNPRWMKRKSTRI